MLHFKNVVKEGLWLSFFFLQAFALAETITKEDVVKRLDAIKNFIPAENYVWDLKFTEGKNVFYGKLQGNQFDVTLNVPAGSLTFDKRSPEKALWNGESMLAQNWFEPLWNQSGCCYGVLGMPFLNWPIQSC